MSCGRAAVLLQHRFDSKSGAKVFLVVPGFTNADVFARSLCAVGILQLKNSISIQHKMRAAARNSPWADEVWMEPVDALILVNRTLVNYGGLL
jgi:hypothetical protein